MKDKFIETQNYIKLVEAFGALEILPPNTPRMGLGYGSFGLGKTFALERLASNKDVIILRCGTTWTKTSVINKLCVELDIDEIGKTSDKYEKIVEALRIDKKPIIVDEVDTILKPDKTTILELFRDIHDEANNTIFFIGMEEANGKLKKHKHYYSRIVNLVKFESICMEDVRKFCELSDIKIEDDLVEYFLKRYANLRQMKVLITRLESWCEMNGYEKCDLKVFKLSEVENG